MLFILYFGVLWHDSVTDEARARLIERGVTDDWQGYFAYGKKFLQGWNRFVGLPKEIWHGVGIDYTQIDDVYLYGESAEAVWNLPAYSGLTWEEEMKRDGEWELLGGLPDSFKRPLVMDYSNIDESSVKPRVLVNCDLGKKGLDFLQLQISPVTKLAFNHLKIHDIFPNDDTIPENIDEWIKNVLDKVEGDGDNDDDQEVDEDIDDDIDDASRGKGKGKGKSKGKGKGKGKAKGKGKGKTKGKGQGKLKVDKSKQQAKAGKNSSRSQSIQDNQSRVGSRTHVKQTARKARDSSTIAYANVDSNSDATTGQESRNPSMASTIASRQEESEMAKVNKIYRIPSQ